jgi:hypothetical protein
MLELLHPFEGTIINLNTATSSCILISRHDHVLSFIGMRVELLNNYPHNYLMDHDCNTKYLD